MRLGNDCISIYGSHQFTDAFGIYKECKRCGAHNYIHQDNPHAKGLDINQDWIGENVVSIKVGSKWNDEPMEENSGYGVERRVVIRDSDMHDCNRWFMYKHLGMIKPTPEMKREALPLSNPEE